MNGTLATKEVTKERGMSLPPAPPQRDERRTEALKTAHAQNEKQFGKGSIMRLGGDAKLDIEGITTGSLGLDLALGGKGFPRGRVVEVFGPEGSGKTTLCLTIIANAQKAGGSALFIDAEHAMDPSYAQKLGVNLDELLLNQPDSGEQALEIADMMVRSSSLDVIVIDSVAALVPKAELEGDMGDAHVGIQARMMSQALRKLGGSISKTRTCVIFINQIREKIGVMFGNPETTPGGRALKFWASVRLEVRRGELLKNGTDAYGARTKVKVVKNKVAPPFKQAEFDMVFGKGISASADLLDLAVENDIVSKAGTYYNYKDTRLGQGRDNAKTFLDDNPEVFAELDTAVRAVIAPPKTDVDPAIVAAIEE